MILVRTKSGYLLQIVKENLAFCNKPVPGFSHIPTTHIYKWKLQKNL